MSINKLDPIQSVTYERGQYNLARLEIGLSLTIR